MLHPMLTALLPLVLSSACATAPDFALRDRTAAQLVVVTYNVNYGLAGHGDILDALELIDADVVLLQETTPAWERALAKRFQKTYPHRRFHHHDAAGGLGVLSKARITESELLPAVTWFPAWRGVVSTPVGPIEFLNVHLRPPFHDDGSVVKGWFTTPAMRDDEIAAFSLALEGKHPIVVVGDMNEGVGTSHAAFARARSRRCARSHPRRHHVEMAARRRRLAGPLRSRLRRQRATRDRARDGSRGRCV
jgi:endonuclease/exonuclease/phosphatase (EEP) superfamily protein YafD